jgi:hypothetical protein
LAAVALVACGHDIQTTSGQAYLAAQPDWRAVQPMNAANVPAIDRAVREAASAEPLLRFPARLGLARLERGRVTAIPPEEADAWLALGKRLGPGFGEFVAINPLIAQLTAGTGDRSVARSSVDVIRLGAARQHVDAVLIYEVVTSDRGPATPFSVLDLTIVGAFLIPTRMVTGEANAYAMLVDVRNGYPYGNAMARAEDSTLTSLAGTGSAARQTTGAARVTAVENLTGVVHGMMGRLAIELAALPPRRTRPESTRR